MDDAACDQEDGEQHGERIGVGGAPVQIELEAKERRHLHALQAVGAAGERARAVRRLGEQQPEPERQHDERQVPKADDDVARDIA